MSTRPNRDFPLLIEIHDPVSGTAELIAQVSQYDTDEHQGGHAYVMAQALANDVDPDVRVRDTGYEVGDPDGIKVYPGLHHQAWIEEGQRNGWID